MTSRVLFAVLLTATSCLVALAGPSTLLRAPSDVEGRGAREDAQGGDQFLDGIGETGLVARYVLNGNAEDSSRNQFHATVRGTGGAFVDDEQFRRVLLLTGDGSHLQLPGETLAGEDTISVTGWLYLPTGASGPFFDFGQSAATQALRRRRTRQASAPRSSWTARCAARRRRAVSREPVDALRRRARSGQPRADDLPRRREGRPGDGRHGERRADRASNGARRESPLHRALAGRRRADAPRAIARRPPLSHRAERPARSRRFAATRWRRPQTTRGRGRRRPEISTAAHPAGIAARLAAVATSPTSPSKPSSARCRGCRRRAGDLSRRAAAGRRSRDLAVADRQQRGA